jgi:hypothetical protein
MAVIGFSLGTLWVVSTMYCGVLKADTNYQNNVNDAMSQSFFVTTNANVTVVLSDADYTLVHLGIQDDGSTASGAGDYIVMMPSRNADGTSITMDVSYAAGKKMIIRQGAAATFNATPIPDGPDGPREVQLKAAFHGAACQLIRGHHGG